MERLCCSVYGQNDGVEAFNASTCCPSRCQDRVGVRVRVRNDSHGIPDECSMVAVLSPVQAPDLSTHHLSMPQQTEWQCIMQQLAAYPEELVCPCPEALTSYPRFHPTNNVCSGTVIFNFVSASAADRTNLQPAPCTGLTLILIQTLIIPQPGAQPRTASTRRRGHADCHADR